MCANDDCGRVVNLQLLFASPTEVWQKATTGEPLRRPTDPNAIRMVTDYNQEDQRRIMDAFLTAARAQVPPRTNDTTANCSDVLDDCLCVESSTIDAQGSYTQPFKAVFFFLPGQDYVVSGNIEVQFAVYKKKCVPQIKSKETTSRWQVPNPVTTVLKK